MRKYTLLEMKKRRKIFNIVDSSLLSSILNIYVTIYKHLSSVAKSSSIFVSNYYQECGSKRHSIRAQLCEQGAHFDDGDANEVLNFFSNAVFKSCQTNFVSAASKKTETRKSIKELGNICEETDRGLFCISGGALGEMFNKARGKRKFKSQHIVPTNIANQRHLDIIKRMQMTFDEKKSQLPVSLSCRDRGGLIVPKACFLPFIRKLFISIMEFSTTTALRTHKGKLIKVRVFNCILLIKVNCNL